MSKQLCNLIKNGGGSKYTEYIGEPVTVALSGSHTVNQYATKIAWISEDRKTIHLIGTASLDSGTFDVTRALRWNASLTFNGKNYTASDCCTPTSSQIMNYVSGYNLGFAYWLNDQFAPNPAYGWGIDKYGGVTTPGNTTQLGVVVYIVLVL